MSFLKSPKKLIFGISCLEHYRTVIACKSYDLRNIGVIRLKLISNIILFFWKKSAKIMNAGLNKKYYRIVRKTHISKSTE